MLYATSRKPISWDSPHRLWIRLTPLMFRNREQAYQLWLHFAFTESEEKNERHHGQVLKICFCNLISALLVLRAPLALLAAGATFCGFDENTPTVDSYPDRMLRTRGKI